MAWTASALHGPSASPSVPGLMQRHENASLSHSACSCHLGPMKHHLCPLPHNVSPELIPASSGSVSSLLEAQKARGVSVLEEMEILTPVLQGPGFSTHVPTSACTPPPTPGDPQVSSIVCLFPTECQLCEDREFCPSCSLWYHALCLQQNSTHSRCFLIIVTGTNE